jgi:hypothetical protein
MDNTRIELTGEQEKRLEELSDLLGDDTIRRMRESTIRQLAINEADDILGTARGLRKGAG